jgi:surfactin synthase thioesterase subunit
VVSVVDIRLLMLWVNFASIKQRQRWDVSIQEPIFEIVGSSDIWTYWENVHGWCHRCSGDGELATTDRAAYYPKKYREDLVRCYECGGTGKQRHEMRFWIE